MERALTSQRAGRHAEAIAAYEAALALEPRSFDALHMLGVTLYQQGLFEMALARINAAIAVRGDIAAAHFNRDLVIKAMAKQRATERELAAEILPRLAALCAGADAWPCCLATDEPVHVFVARSRVDVALADTVATLIGALPALPTLWIRPDAEVDREIAAQWRCVPTAVDLKSGSHPRHGNVIFAGLDARATAWLPDWRPGRIALVCDDYAPGPLIDRLRELSDEGRRRVALVYANAALERRVRLPGTVLGDRAAVGATQ